MFVGLDIFSVKNEINRPISSIKSGRLLKPMGLKSMKCNTEEFRQAR